jgi:SAM-dependent methyltransferase
VSAGDPVDGLLLPPISMLLEHIPGITLHADPYTGPFEAHYHQVSRTQTWDVGAISAIVDAEGGPVLDLGCGWGRLAMRLARDGHHVTAVDASVPALERLRRHIAADPSLAERIDVVRGDIADAELLPPRRFRVVAVGDLSVNIFTTDAAIGRLLEAARRAMTDDGCLCLPVLDEESLDQVTGRRGMSATRFVDDTGRERLLWFVLHHEPGGPYVRRTYFIQDDNGGDGTLRGHATAVRERLWTPASLLPHITRAGLRIAETQRLWMPSAVGTPLRTVVLTIRHGTEGPAS